VPKTPIGGNRLTPVSHPSGDYAFLPGIDPYSCGVVANPGFEIVQVTFQSPPTLPEGFSRIAEFLNQNNRPKAALCAIALRSTLPYTFEGFSSFNKGYAETLKSWGVFVDGVNPIARTNVAPMLHAPAGASMYSFSFTRPSTTNVPTFVVAGAGELPEGKLSREDIVALGDTSLKGISSKARFVMDLMENRLIGLGGNWSMVTTVNVYTVHAWISLLPDIVLGRMGTATIDGVNWHYSRPPIEEIEFEMDMRGTRTEWTI
jgi:hypothetical protein